jgi:hypothetical protein
MKPLPAALLIATLVATGAFVSPEARAAVIVLQNATATFSQVDFTVGKAIDGTTADDRGWAIDHGTGTAQTAVFEAQSDAGFEGGSMLTFGVASLHIGTPNHNLGRFRLSLTTDDRSTFADGLESGGDVTANWTVLHLASFSSANGQTLTEQPDFSLLASGTNPSTDTLTLTAATSLTGITGIRLEMLPDLSLPSNGPGRAGSNGNFVLSEFTVGITAVPEPADHAAVAGLALVAFGTWRRCLR